MRKRLLSYRHQLYFCGLLLLLVNTSWMTPNPKLQSQNIQWSPPETMPGISLEAYPPILLADQNRTVHAFLSQWMGDADASVNAIVYSQWTPQYGWSAPVDVIVSPYREARMTSAYLDKSGIIHVVFYGGNGITGDIYYTRAYAAVAGNARSWSMPVLVGEAAGDPESAAIVSDGLDQLSIIFHGKRDGYGLYVVDSKDGGNTWVDQRPIFLADGDAPYMWRINAIKGEAGWFHVIWNSYSESGQGRAIYYARNKIGESEWSTPFTLAATPEGLGTQTPTIIEYDGVLYALYILPPKVSMRRSVDNGLTWDDSVALFSRHVGVNGSLSMVIDSNKDLHLFFGQRITGSQGTPDIHGMWHSTWSNGRWTEPNAVVKGPRIVDIEGTGSFDPYDARAIVSQGNVVLVTWRTDPGGKGDIKANGVWYSYAMLNAPETPIATLPVPSVIEEIPATTVPSPTVTLEPEPTPQVLLDKERDTRSPLVSIVVGVMILAFLRILYSLFSRH